MPAGGRLELMGVNVRMRRGKAPRLGSMRLVRRASVERVTLCLDLLSSCDGKAEDLMLNFEFEHGIAFSLHCFMAGPAELEQEPKVESTRASRALAVFKSDAELFVAGDADKSSDCCTAWTDFVLGSDAL
jgi:hypothetical protein